MDNNTTLIKLKSLMVQRNWSVYKLAQKSDIPYSSLNNLFQRNTEPTLPTLRKICSGLGISLSSFFSDELPPKTIKYTAQEMELISLYQHLSSTDKKLLVTYAYGLNKKIPD